MADLCSICETALLQQPTTEFLCHHKCHTNCFLLTMANTHPTQIFFLHCESCQQAIFPQAEQEQEIEGPNEEEEEEFELEGQEDMESVSTWEAEADRISNLYDTNAEFRALLKKYRDSIRGFYQPRRAFFQVVRSKKLEIAPLYAQIKAQVEGTYNVKKDQIMNSSEYKMYKKAQAKYQRYWILLREKYNFRHSSLYGLRNKPGCRRLRRPYFWRDSPCHIIRRALRLRLPF